MYVTKSVGVLGFAGCVLLLACAGNSSGGNGGGSSGGGSSGSSSGSSATCDNINGTWAGSDNVDASSCGQGTYSDSGSMVITQAAGSCSLSISYYDLGTWPGSVSGSSLTFSGSYPKDNGTVTLDNVDLTISQDLTTISGTITWSYTGPTKSCSGSTTISGTKSQT